MSSKPDAYPLQTISHGQLKRLASPENLKHSWQHGLISSALMNRCGIQSKNYIAPSIGLFSSPTSTNHTFIFYKNNTLFSNALRAVFFLTKQAISSLSRKFTNWPSSNMSSYQRERFILMTYLPILKVVKKPALFATNTTLSVTMNFSTGSTASSDPAPTAPYSD